MKLSHLDRTRLLSLQARCIKSLEDMIDHPFNFSLVIRHLKELISIDAGQKQIMEPFSQKAKMLAAQLGLPKFNFSAVKNKTELQEVLQILDEVSKITTNLEVMQLTAHAFAKNKLKALEYQIIDEQTDDGFRTRSTHSESFTIEFVDQGTLILSSLKNKEVLDQGEALFANKIRELIAADHQQQRRNRI